MLIYLYINAALLTLSGREGLVIEYKYIFPGESWHNHGSCIVELPGGDLLACWFHGSGERQADDVYIEGSRLDKGMNAWSERFLMADTPGLPDTNCTMLIDRNERLWLFWPVIQDNRWESALMKYKTSTDYRRNSGPPVWEQEKVLHVKPGDQFPELVRAKTADYMSHTQISHTGIEWAANNFLQADDKLTRRLGWFTRAHPLQLPGGRILLGLYSDGFSFSLTGISDDDGITWRWSEPMVGGGNIQPSYALKPDGTLVAYMRDNGPAPKRVHVSESVDGGVHWNKVYDHPHLPNPGAGLEVMNLRDGRMAVVLNDLEQGRHRLSFGISSDGGSSFPDLHIIEEAPSGTASYHYPSMVHGSDGYIHITYSAFEKNSSTDQWEKAIKYARFLPDPSGG